MASRELNIIVKAKNLASSVLKGVKSDLNGLGGIGAKAGRNLAANFERGVITAGAGLVGFTGLAIKTAADFEDAFAGVQKTVDEVELAAAGLTFGELMDDFRAMAREMPIAFEELAAIGEAAGALGIAAGDIDDFTETVAKLSVTTDLTAESASTALGHLGTILGLTGTDFEQLADSLVALGNDGASTESQIIDIAERFAAAGNLAGLSKEEILALASTTASMGVEAEAAGSSLSRIFNRVATDIGTGSEKAATFADSLGLSAGELKNAWEKDALGTFQDFLGVLDDLDSFDQAALLKSIGITGVRDINAIQLLASGAEELTDQLETARTAQGALNEEAGKKFATTASMWEKTKNIARDFGYIVGRELLPVVNDLLTDFADFMALPTTQTAIQEFAKDFAANVREAVDWLRSLDWGQIGSTMGTVAGVAKGILDAFLAMPGWVQTAVLTGWGLNKVTGGAVGDLVGLIGKNIIKGVLNLNAGVVNVNGKVVNGPGGGGPTGGGKGGGKGKFPFFGVVGALSVPLMLSGSDNPDATHAGRSHQELNRMLEEGVISEAEYVRLWKQAYDESVAGTGGGRSMGGEIGQDSSGFDRMMLTHARTQEAMQHRENTLAQAAVDADRSMLNSVRSQQGLLSQIRDKRTVFNPHVNVTANINNVVSISTGQVLRQINSYRQSLNQGTSVSGFI